MPALLQVLAVVSPLIKALGPAADPANLKRLPVAAAAVWLFYTGEPRRCLAWCAKVAPGGLHCVYATAVLVYATEQLIPSMPSMPSMPAAAKRVGWMWCMTLQHVPMPWPPAR